MKANKVLVVYARGTSKTLNKVKEVLRKHNANFKCVHRDDVTKSMFSNLDLVITVGGDGTFLSTCQYVVSTPVLGVNSFVIRNEGFFTRSDGKNFEKHFGNILSDKFYMKQINRLEARIGKKSLSSALNEVFVGHKKPYRTARYELSVGNTTEKQKSSGVLVSTAAGSHGWARSAGNKPVPLESKVVLLTVREPYKGAFTKSCILSAIVHKDVRIKALMDGCIVAIDSNREIVLPKNKSVVIKKSKTPLMFVTFSKREVWRGLRD